MAKFNVYDLSAKEVGNIELADGVFNIEVNNQAIFDAVLRQRASWRQGTHDTKSRSEVSGGGKKPFRQKGTGRARQGSIRATQHRGGGIVFGPTPRKYLFKLNRKVRRLALKSAISLKTQEENITILDSIVMNEVKTKEFVKVMDAFGFDRKVLFVVDLEEDFNNAYLSMRNLPNAAMVAVEGINVYDVMDVRKLVMTKAAAKKIEEVLSND